MIEVSTSPGTVRLRVGLTAAQVGKALTVSATADGGQPRIVRGWDAVPAPLTAVVIDHEAELTVPVRYSVTLDGVEVEAATTTLPATFPLLTEPIRGTHIPVIIQEWPERSYERQGQVLEISRSADPIVIEGVEMRPQSTITVIHPTDGTSAADLVTLLAGSSVLRIRPACTSLPTEWVSVRSRRRRAFSRRPGAAWVDVMELRHLGQPAPDEVAVGATLGDLHEAVPGTLGDIRTRWPGVLADIAYEAFS